MNHGHKNNGNYKKLYFWQRISENFLNVGAATCSREDPREAANVAWLIIDA